MGYNNNRAQFACLVLGVLLAMHPSTNTRGPSRSGNVSLTEELLSLGADVDVRRTKLGWQNTSTRDYKNVFLLFL